MNRIRGKKGNITMVNLDIHRIIKNCYKELYVQKSKDLEGMDRFLDTYQLSKLNHKVTRI